MKPTYESDLDKRTVDQAIETIRDRVDALGVSEPLIQQYGLGANQILVELPGVSDLDQVKNIIKSTARLEIHAVDGGPFPTEEAATASVNGALPPEQEILPSSGELAGSSGTDYYIVDRTPIVSGSDFRSAEPGVNSEHRAKDGEFHADGRRWRQVLELHQRQHWQEYGSRYGRLRSQRGRYQGRDPR